MGVPVQYCAARGVVKKPKLPGAGTTIRYKKPPTRSKQTMQMKRINANPLEQPDVPMGMINGKMPGSSYEWNIARALWSYGWQFRYQVSVRGGHEFRGGQVLDFLVPTKPAQTPLSVDGGHWHSNAQKEKLYDARLLSALRQKGIQVTNEVLHATDKDCAEYQDARAFIYKNFGRA